MSLPAYLLAVEPDHLRLGGDTRQLRQALRDSPHESRVFRDSGMTLCLRFAPGANPLTDAELIDLLDWLRAQGVAFLEDMTRPYGPGELMRALRADGRVGPFHSLLIRSADDWELVPHG